MYPVLYKNKIILFVTLQRYRKLWTEYYGQTRKSEEEFINELAKLGMKYGRYRIESQQIPEKFLLDINNNFPGAVEKKVTPLSFTLRKYTSRITSDRIFGAKEYPEAPLFISHPSF